jgi:hypothetical protein
MSDFDPTQYVSQDVESTTPHPPLVSNSRISVQKIGKFRQVQIEGEMFWLVDPEFVQNLARRLEVLENHIMELTNTSQRSVNHINRINNSLVDINNSLSRITHND